MEDILIIAVLLAVVGGAIFFIRKQKKQGRKCIGCPSGGECSGKCTCCSEDCQK